MISTTASVLAFALAALASVVVLLVGLTALARFVRVRRNNRRAERIAAARPLVYALIDGDEAELGEAPVKTIDTLVLAMLPQLRGADREGLRAYLDERGVLADGRRQLTSRWPVRRAQAAELLGGAGDLSAAEAIRRMLADPDARVRICAARAIGRLGDADSVRALLAAFRDEDCPVPRSVVGMAIIRAGSPAAPYLRAEVTGSADAAVRELCAELLGHLGDLESMPILVDLIATGDDQEVTAAARALGRIGSPDATAGLLVLLDSPAASVRLGAIWALGAIGDPTSAREVWRSVHDADVEVATAAATLVADLSPETLESLDCCPTALQFQAAARSQLLVNGATR